MYRTRLADRKCDGRTRGRFFDAQTPRHSPALDHTGERRASDFQPGPEDAEVSNSVEHRLAIHQTTLPCLGAAVRIPSSEPSNGNASCTHSSAADTALRALAEKRNVSVIERAENRPMNQHYYTEYWLDCITDFSQMSRKSDLAP
jgi:hypothetical protein